MNQENQQRIQKPKRHLHRRLAAHFGRMLATAGHSWATSEHDVFLRPFHWLRPLARLVPRRVKQASRPVRIVISTVILIIVVGVPGGLVAYHDLMEQRYVLSSATSQLIGPPVVSLSKQLKFNQKSDEYQYNPSAAAGIKPTIGANGEQGISIGGAKYYGVNLARQASKGQTFTDAETKLSFTLVPEFAQMDGRHEAGHLVYPFSQGQVVYTLKDNGLKEDVVVAKPTASVRLKYRLKLPSSLQARLQPDGNVGIYSADPALFGNISFGDSKDQAVVEKARTNAKKTNLVFVIPAPVVKQSGRDLSAGSAKAVFSLKGNILTVTATNLAKLSYPISIDPSVVVSSANSFATGNNEDNNILFNGSGGITRGGLTGGSLSSGWTVATNSFNTPREQGGSVAYNGYLYMISGTVYGGSVVNDIESAPINANGSLGTWQTALNLSGGGQPVSSITDTQAVVYNGYLYLVGGYQYLPGIGSSKTQVTWAQINTNGTLGNLQTVSSLPVGNTGAGIVAYNGYIYMIGGGPSGYGGGGYYNTVYYASINADGTLGSWVTSPNTLPATIGTGQGVAYNGYIYYVGGASGSGYVNTVAYAHVNSDGSVGTWTYTSAFCGVRYGQFTYVYNGYMYLGGGVGGSGCGYSGGQKYDVQYAQINANGTLGAWQETANLDNSANAGERYIVGAAYNGYLYAMGGRNPAGTADSNEVEYAKIDPAGQTGSYNTTTAYTGTLQSGGIVAYNGYLYIVGGSAAGASPLTTVSYISINADGTLGSSWATTSSLIVGEQLTGAVAYNGYMYFVGGYDGSYESYVQYAPINSNGTLGAWNYTHNSTDDGTTFVSGLPNPAGGHIPVAYDGYLYYGGVNGGANGTIYYAPLNSDGTVGTWTIQSNVLNTARTFESTVVYAGYMYKFGGLNSGYLNTYEYAPINSNGSTGTWTQSSGTSGNGSNMIDGIARTYAVAMNGYMYVFGGETSSTPTQTADVQYAPINANGSLGAWSLNTALPGTASFGQFAGYNGYFYSVAGKYNGTRVATTYYAAVNNGGSGTTGTWTTNGTNLPASLEGFGTVAYKGYLYFLGGGDGVSTCNNNVYYAPISSNGSVGSWTSTSSFATPRCYFQVIAYKGYMYVLGGNNIATGTFLNDVQYTPINSNGTLGAWHYTHNSTDDGTTFVAGFTNAREYLSAVTYNGYLYIAGGDGASVGYNDVQYAPINSNGTIGTWNATTSFNNYRTGQQMLAYNGNIYIMGGAHLTSDPRGGYDFNPLNDVQYAPINSNGTIGTWNATTSFNNSRYYFVAAANNGFIYIMGGLGGASSLNDVQYAPINSNGTIGTWNATTGFNTGRSVFGGLIYGGYLYIMGGVSASLLNDIQYTTLAVQPRIAHYSKLIDLASTINGDNGGDPMVTGYRLAGTGNGVFSVCASGATTASAVFGAPKCVTLQSLSSPISWQSAGRYSFLNITIDDSGDAVFPDSANSNVSELDIYFRAAPNRRMRGGQTFTNMNAGQSSSNGFPLNQELDTNGAF